MPAIERVEPEPANNLVRLAGALAEATPVDWDGERAASPGQVRELTNLQRLEALRLMFSRSGSPGDAARPVPEQEFSMSGVWGHLEILRRIGVGAFAEVYLAYDPQLDRRVALKLLRVDRIATDKERFLKEARRLARVQSPHVVTVHGVAEHDGRPGFWMDYLQGPLEKRLHEQGRIAWHAAAMIGVEMCDALSAIHGAGLVHGDVKAANVVWCEETGKHLLMDLGASAEAKPSGVLGSSRCGTPIVMAPEVYLGKSRPSPASDVYSLGVLLYRLVSGSYPVEARNERELHHKLSDPDFTPVPLRDRRADLPLPFIRVVERALEGPHSRYAQAGEFQRALLQSVNPVPVPLAWWRQLWRWLEARPVWQKGLGVASSLVLVGALVIPPYIPLKMQMTLLRGAGGTPQVLTSGAAVYPGDVLSMEFESSQEMFVYVFNENDRKLGELNTLFPLHFSELQNPLQSKTRYVLPGLANGLPIPWPVDETGGTERILVVASRKPLVELEERLRGHRERGSDQALPQRADGQRSPAPTTQDDDALRSIISVPQTPVGQIDLILRDLGKQSRSVRWNLIELENRVRP